MYDSLWNAFCTVHWFMTGEYEVYKSASCYTHDLLNWYYFYILSNVIDSYVAELNAEEKL